MVFGGGFRKQLSIDGCFSLSEARAPTRPGQSVFLCSLDYMPVRRACQADRDLPEPRRAARKSRRHAHCRRPPWCPPSLRKNTPVGLEVSSWVAMMASIFCSAVLGLLEGAERPGLRARPWRSRCRRRMLQSASHPLAVMSSAGVEVAHVRRRAGEVVRDPVDAAAAVWRWRPARDWRGPCASAA